MDSVAQTHKHTHPHKLTHTCRDAWPHRCELTQIFFVSYTQ